MKHQVPEIDYSSLSLPPARGRELKHIKTATELYELNRLPPARGHELKHDRKFCREYFLGLPPARGRELKH